MVVIGVEAGDQATFVLRQGAAIVDSLDQKERRVRPRSRRSSPLGPSTSGYGSASRSGWELRDMMQRVDLALNTETEVRLQIQNTEYHGRWTQIYIMEEETIIFMPRCWSIKEVTFRKRGEFPNQAKEVDIYISES